MGTVYQGVDGVRREMASAKVGVAGVVRDVTEIYAGVDGVRRLVWQKAPQPQPGAEAWTRIERAGSGSMGKYIPVFYFPEAVEKYEDGSSYVNLGAPVVVELSSVPHEDAWFMLREEVGRYVYMTTGYDGDMSYEKYQVLDMGTQLPESGVTILEAGYMDILGTDMVVVLDNYDLQYNESGATLTWTSAYECQLYNATYLFVWHPGLGSILETRGETEWNYDLIICNVWTIQ